MEEVMSPRWEKRVVALKQEEEEEEQKRSQPAIYRVHSSLRDLNKDHFDSTILPLGLASKIQRPEREVDQLKLDVTIKFSADIAQNADQVQEADRWQENWTRISKSVVPNPDAMKRLYNEHWLLHEPQDKIRSILARDAIFLACFLIYFCRCGPSPDPELKETCQFFDEKSRRLRLLVFKDICKLENQLPLELIKNVIALAYERRLNLGEHECQNKASETLEKICKCFVSKLLTSLPACQFTVTNEAQMSQFRAVRQRSLTQDADKNSTNIGAENRYPPGDLEANNGDPSSIAKLKETICPPFGFRGSAGFSKLKQLTSLRSWKTRSPDSEAVEMSTTDSRTPRDQLHKCKHLLHCLAEVLWCEAEVNNKTDRGTKEDADVHCESHWNQHLPTAKELHKYGVEFQGHKEFHPKFVHFSFLRGKFKPTLFLPEIGAVDEDTEELWRNLLAFEDAYMKEDERRSFMSYVQFMKDLISTKEDVRLLFKGKRPVIIVNDLDNYKAVANMYKSVSKNHVRASNAEWSSIRKEVREYYESTFSKRIAEFFQADANKWWLVLARIGATLIFVLGVVTFVFLVLIRFIL